MVVKRTAESTPRITLHLTGAGAIVVFPGAAPSAGYAVLALRGMPAHSASVVEAEMALSSLRVAWHAAPRGSSATPSARGALCRPVQIRDWLQGDSKARALTRVPKAGAFGEDPRVDRRLGARRLWSAHAQGFYRLAPKSGRPAVSYWASERKLSEKEQALKFQLDAVLQRKAVKPGKRAPGRRPRLVSFVAPLPDPQQSRTSSQHSAPIQPLRLQGRGRGCLFFSL